VTVAVQALSPKLPLPIVIIIPRFFSDNEGLLGLGDIILPSFFLSFLLRYDVDCISLSSKVKDKTKIKLREIMKEGKYFKVGIIGYLFGLLSALTALVITRLAQPALLYLVPFTIIPVAAKSLFSSQFLLLWHGNLPPRELEQTDLPNSNPPAQLQQEETDDEISIDLLTPPSASKFDSSETTNSLLDNLDDNTNSKTNIYSN